MSKDFSLPQFVLVCISGNVIVELDPVHTGPDLYGHHINLKSLKTSMTLKFVIILQNLIKAYHRKSGKSKYDRKLTLLTELDVETTRIRSRVNGVLMSEKLDSNNALKIVCWVFAMPAVKKASATENMQL